MQQVAELAGFFAAHAVWCVSDAEMLIPIVGFVKTGNQREMMRMLTERVEDGVAQGRQWIAQNSEGAVCATLVFDGLITLASGKTDALIVEAYQLQSPKWSFVMAIPYRPASSPNGFAVHRPKFCGSEGFEPDLKSLVDAFFTGVDQHEKGSAVWNKHLDQSL